MKKADKILRRADVFEKLADCESKSEIKKVLAQDANYPGSEFTSDPSNPSAPVAPAATPASKPSVVRPVQYSAADSLKTKEQILSFQKNITNYVARDPEFAKKLNAALGGIPWGSGKNKDVDGILGKRTQTAWQQYQAHYTKTNPTQDMAKTQQMTDRVAYSSLMTLRQKIQTIYNRLYKETGGFKNTQNKGSDDIWKQFTAEVNPEYTNLYLASTNNMLQEDTNKEFLSLANYLKSLSGGYMRNPGPIPQSLLNA